MNPNEMLLVIPHSLLTSETIDGDVHGVSLWKQYVLLIKINCFINIYVTNSPC